jgi:hypothetical protein
MGDSRSPISISSINSQLRQTDLHPEAIGPDKALHNNRGPQSPMPGRRRRRKRTHEERRHLLLCFTNVWDPSFFTRHDLTGKDDVSAVEAKKSIGDVGDKLTIFLQDLGCPCEADEVKRYCEDASLEDLEDGVGEARERRAAWLDDRNSLDQTGSGNARLYDNPLTATGLLKYLKQSVGTRSELPLRLTKSNLLTLYQRYNNGDQPNAERRLMWGFLAFRFMCSTLTSCSYIADLTPEYILALAVTAPFHQVPALRDAMCKYVAFQPSIRVIIPVSRAIFPSR